MVRVFGIRHHGPGSAASLRQALRQWQPDSVLVEGPPEGDALIARVADEKLRPPVSLLVYPLEDARRGVNFPFAEFSPEYQALRYATMAGVPARFIDLPISNMLALELEAAQAPQADSPGEAIANGLIRGRDPLLALATAAGYEDGERWWEHLVEQRQDAFGVFEAILEAISALREGEGAPGDGASSRRARIEALREAHMRQTIRATMAEGRERIAVVCGAWHAPRLEAPGNAKADAAALKGLPRLKVAATWVPWTHGRLSTDSGYGAGVEAPGWYAHLWSCANQAGGGGTQLYGDDVAIRWMARVATLLRSRDLDASSAGVIEAVRMAEALAALRGRRMPDLGELTDAARSVLCFGSDVPLQVIARELVIGETLGAVPEDAASVPLQQDVQREQRRLRLSPEAADRTLELDLRNANDLDRSRLIHRLGLLGIPWGTSRPASGKGTFREVWLLRWDPEFAVRIIEAAMWGNTVLSAATARASALASPEQEETGTPRVPALSSLLNVALLADLPGAIGEILRRLEDEAAIATDIAHLMDALPALANVLRYGNVRGDGAGLVDPIVSAFVARICIGISGACASLNDDAAGDMLARIIRTDGAIRLTQVPEHGAEWRASLSRLASQRGLHGLIAGRATRMLLDADAIDAATAAAQMNLALSPAGDPSQSAAWVEGFLGQSGLLLVHDERLWRVIWAWTASLTAPAFQTVLPLLRRTFSRFPAPERRKLGERARNQDDAVADSGAPGGLLSSSSDPELDWIRADRALPAMMRVLGLEAPKTP